MLDFVLCVLKLWPVPRNEELKLLEREMPLQPIRVASVFADKDKDEFDDGDTSLIDKERDVGDFLVSEKLLFNGFIYRHRCVSE